MITFLIYNFASFGYHLLELFNRIWGVFLQAVRLILNLIPGFPGKFGLKDQINITLDEIDFAITGFFYEYQKKCLLKIYIIEVQRGVEEEDFE